MYLLQLTYCSAVVKLRTWLARERVPWASIPHPHLTLPLVAILPHSPYDIYYLYSLLVYLTVLQIHSLVGLCLYVFLTFEFFLHPPLLSLPPRAGDIYVPFLLVRSIPPPLLFWSIYKYPRPSKRRI